MAVKRTSDPRFGLASLAVTLLVAIGFGIFVLPRLGGRVERKPAPDFALPVIHGGERGSRVRLSEQRGKAVLLDFWASWCKPCRDQAKVLERVRSKHPELVVIGVNVNDSAEEAARYLKSENPPWVVVEDNAGFANRAFEVETLPTLVAIDKAGNVVAIRRRFVPEKELTALLDELLE